jgi:hypothetical protein
MVSRAQMKKAFCSPLGHCVKQITEGWEHHLTHFILEFTPHLQDEEAETQIFGKGLEEYLLSVS